MTEEDVDYSNGPFLRDSESPGGPAGRREEGAGSPRDATRTGRSRSILERMEHHERAGEPTALQKFRLERMRELLRVVKRRIRPSRILRVRCGTDRCRHQSAGFLRLLCLKGSRLLALIAPLGKGSGEQSSRLLVAAVLWWHDLCRSHRPARLLLLDAHAGTSRLLSLVDLLRLPAVCMTTGGSPPGNSRSVHPDLVPSHLSTPDELFPLADPPSILLLKILELRPGLELIYRRKQWELCLNGMTVAWDQSSRTVCYDPQEPRSAGTEGLEPLLLFVDQVIRFRNPRSPDKTHPYYQAAPERWFESVVMRNFRLLLPDAGAFLYCQVPTWVEAERKVIDLLSVTGDGQLAVLELKLEKDLGLVFQGLDYWDRVRWHLRRGDFARAGYFPGLCLSDEPPRLILVAPLFEFHRTLPIVGRYLRNSPRIEFLGVNSNWRNRLKILRRFEL